MNSSLKITSGWILQGAAWMLFAAGGLGFWIGGRAIHEFAHVQRATAEIIGLGLAAVLCVIGFALRSVGQGLTEGDEDAESEAPREGT